MYFKRLEIHGFKSFAEPVVIDFHEGITCIVGPNGSGKSNISDAIRWVLGEQSPKALRGGKMEEVIFAGTASRKSKGMAEVTLVIDNSEGILKIDYNEVAITRRMYRSGESEYLINGNRARLRDIRDLIMDTGIGVDGYSIIGQGKIADIVSGKPESRREIFEEAAGISMYKSRKADAERKLEKTSLNLSRAQDIIAEIETQEEKLLEESNKAKEYLKLSEELKVIDINIILKNIETVTKNNGTYRSDIAELAADIKEISSDKAKTDIQIAEASEHKEILEKKAGENRDEIMSLVQEIGDIINKKQVSEERLAGIENEEKHVRDEIAVIKRKTLAEEDTLDRGRKSFAKTQEQLNEVTRRVQEAAAESDARTTERIRLDDLVSQDQNRLFDFHRRCTEKESDIKSYENLRDSLSKRKREISILSDTSSKNQKNYDIEIEKNSRLLKQEKETLEVTKKKSEEYVLNDTRLREKISENRTLSDEKKIELSRIMSRKKTMEEMESNFEGYNHAVRTIMRASLPGVTGVAGDMMTVPQGFETAIETAMGGAMQNIICEDNRAARTGVIYLKNNRAGRLTFLPVSRIQGRKFRVTQKMQAEKGFMGIASDIVSYEEEYRGIYEYLLGRVIIVDNMDTAMRFSEMANSFRYVTLEGEIINNAGAITGGAYKNKSANILERKSEIRGLQDKIAVLEGEIKKLMEAEVVLERDYNKNIEISKASEETIRDSEMKILALEGNKKAVQERLEEERGHGGRYVTELESIEEELKRAGESIDFTREDLAETQRETGEISRALSKNTDLLARAKKAESAAYEKVTEGKIEYNRIEGKMKSEEAMCSRIEETLRVYGNEIQEKEKSLGLLQSEKEEILSGSGVEMGTIEAKEERKKILESEVDRLTREKEVIFEKQKVLTEEQKRREIKLNSTVDRKNDIEIKLAKNETKLDNLKDRLWDDFEVAYMKALDMKQEHFAMAPALKESRQLKSRIRDMGDVNIGSIEEYDAVKKRLDFLTEQRDDIIEGRDELNTIIEEMDRTIKSRFKENFDDIVTNFENIFRELFGGGHAELRMEDENNPLESGIDIIAQPPGKKLQNINLMSGGEKTMTAIALMFAVLKTKPTPFCILDEVEAALDDTNIDRFANYLRNFEEIQFAIITHQKETMEYADVLYGITMAEHGISKVLSLKLDEEYDF